MLRWFLKVLLLVLPHFLQAQYPYMKHYTTADGLPSNTINDMLQDDAGFMWFATDEGVSRFDGHHFTNYRKADGLADDDVIRLGKDHEGRIWFLGFNGKASFYSNGIFYNENNSKIAALTKLGSTFAKFMISRSGAVYLVSNSDGFIRVIGDSVKTFSKEKLLMDFGIKFTSGYKGLKMDTAGSIWIFTRDSVYIMEEGTEHVSMLSQQLFPEKMFEGYFLSDGSVVIPRNGKLFRYAGASIDSSEKLTTSWYGQYVSVEEDGKHNLWLLYNSGAHLFRNKLLGAAHHTRLLEADYCGHVFSDSEGNTWLSPLRRGIYLIPSLDVQFLHTDIGLVNNNVTALAEHPDGVIAGFSNGSVQAVTYRNKTIALQPPVGAGSYIIAIFPGRRNELLLLTNSEAITCDEKLKELWRSPSVWAKSYYQISHDTLLVGGGFVLSLLSKNKLELLYKFPRENRIYAIEQERDQTLWLGTEQGLYSLKDSVIQFYGEQFPQLKGKINDLQLDNRQRLWIASSQNGILVLQDNQLLQIVKNEERISGRKILITDDQVVYAGTDKGIFIIRENRDAGFQISRIRKSDGLPSEKVNALLVKDQLLWIGTDEGLEVFPLERTFSSLSTVPIELTAFTVNGISYIAGTVHHFDYLQNNIHLSFAGISFREASAVYYRYKLRQDDSIWQYTNTSSLNLPELPPGKYGITIQAATTGSNWSASPLQLAFSIHAPFWKQAWFYAMAILATGLFALFIVRYRYKVKLSKEQQERKTVEGELAALRSQMNPHFIFNSLNAIQDFIFQHKTEEANEYLTKFARLMRAILNQSRKQFASIEEECELLSMYLELEALRFNHAFSWEFKIGKGIITSEMMIPSMLLQPVVENSIKHAFRNLKRKGLLIISFESEPGTIRCEVQDNGSGRSATGSNGNSLALSITQERLAMLNQSMQQSCTMEVTDLFDEGIPAGLKTVFRFPAGIYDGQKEAI
jgi:ligand-binding sensor domain-containing protein